MKIYTKTGDKGETSLFTGQRVHKNDANIIALGSIDECNSSIGLAIAHLPVDPAMAPIREQLETIQHALFDVGAHVATPRSRASEAKLEKTRFDPEETALLEQWIDEMDAVLPTLKTFILPGGHPSGASLHLARSICRRAERTIIPLHLKGDISDHAIIYLNRLSDYLFCLSRYVNFLCKSPETFWKPHKIKKNFT